MNQNREKALKDLNMAVQDQHEKQMEKFCEDNMGKAMMSLNMLLE